MVLPKGWIDCNLPILCNIKTGKMDANHERKDGKYRFYTCSSTYTFCNTHSFNGECIIIPGNGDIGQVYYYNGQFEAYQRTYVLDDIHIMPKYLYYHMLWNWRYINSDKQYGSTIRYIRIGNFENYKIHLPPLAEQKRIIAKIDMLFLGLDKGVDYLHAIKAQLKTYRQAVLKWAFEGKLTGHLPSIFTDKNIGDFFDITGGLTKNSHRDDLLVKMPYLSVANVYYNSLDLTVVKNIGVTKAEIERTRLLPNDLLFVEGNGSREQIGRVASWNGEIDKCLHQNHIIKGRPNGSMIVKYALYYFMSKTGRDQILSIASSTSGLYTLSINKIKSLKIPYCALSEQNKIVTAIESRLSVCDKIEQLIDENLIKADALRQSILKKAFEGRLIPQDPDDESAVVLLERIKAERSKKNGRK
ncbi:hypothetical protein AGMMS49546_20360 [Spirochaetia bacterium]|nr:hypothetical protein AGMMS49546_20360 [Spirochaetia bacterium]